ncbi:MAG: hypothetical protein ABIX28_07460 [Vicinamibacterales bacterium]
MRVFIGSASALVLAFTISAGPTAQSAPPSAAQGAPPPQGAGRAGGGRQAAGGPDPARVIPGGGVLVQGWTGKVDAAEAANGQVLNNSKLSQDGAALHVETGPATTYWSPANRAAGTYTVKATFTEPKYMNANSHPHPYGIMVAGNDLGTPQQSYLYCSAYGNGNFIVRGFGPSESATTDTVFSLSGRGATNEAVHKAAGPGQSVTQEIAVTVKADSVECAINGTVVGTYPKADVVAAGKLKSTDGVYGIRFAHNTDATVTGLALVK